MLPFIQQHYAKDWLCWAHVPGACELAPPRSRRVARQLGFVSRGWRAAHAPVSNTCFQNGAPLPAGSFPGYIPPPHPSPPPVQTTQRQARGREAGSPCGAGTELGPLQLRMSCLAHCCDRRQHCEIGVSHRRACRRKASTVRSNWHTRKCDRRQVGTVRRVVCRHHQRGRGTTRRDAVPPPPAMCCTVTG